ncbi:MAG: hypothetical protein KY467_13095 [Gemmatimonadetes bacterium]|nr:hypothetical protein [Gemmatimonadota bacterium]
MRALVVVLMSVGAASAVPAAPDAFHRAAADARSVLDQVERAEAAYRVRHGRYTASLRALGVERPRGVDLRIAAEGPAGYSAVAITSTEECAVFHGRARPPRHWVRTPGRIACRGR